MEIHVSFLSAQNKEKRDNKQAVASSSLKRTAPTFLCSATTGWGKMSMRKSNISVSESGPNAALAMSFLCKVRLLQRAVKFQDRRVSSRIKISHALASRSGASWEMNLTAPSSSFMIFFTRARGSACTLNFSDVGSISWMSLL